MTRRAGAIAALGLLCSAGCSFEAEAPAGTLISCKSDEDCPPDHSCVAAISRCVLAEQVVTEAPFLLEGSTVEPAISGINTLEVLVRFQVSQPLLQDPLVAIELGARTAGLTLVPEATDRAALTYTFRHVPTGSEEEGVHAITVNLLDSYGNAADGLSAGSLAIDRTPPALVAPAQLSSPSVRIDGTVEVTFALDEELLAPPEVFLAGAEAQSAFSPVEGAPEGSFRYSLAPTRAISERIYEVTVRATDLAGNVGELAGGELLLDFTAPTILSDPAVLIEPALARPGDTIAVRIAFSEPVARATVLGTLGAEQIVFDRGPSAGGILTFLHPVARGQHPDGTYAVMLQDVEDAGGNRGPSRRLGSVTLDADAPVLEGLTVAGTTFSTVPGRDVVRLTFTSSELLSGPAAVTASLAGKPMPCTVLPDDPRVSCEVTLDGTEAQGPQPVSVQARDDAGNLGTGSAIVTLDFTAPAVVAATASPAAGRVGDVLAYAITASEGLVAPPRVIVSGAAGLLFTLEPGSDFLFTHLVDGTEVEGTYTVQLELIDEAGNSSGLVAGPSFSLDTSIPSVSSLATDRQVYSAQPGYDLVTLTVTISEALPASGLTATIGGRPMTCVAPVETPGVITCTYAITGQEGEGSQLILVYARDSSGNQGSAATRATFDFSAPRLLVSRAAPPIAHTGSNLVYTIVADEILVGPPLVSVSGPGPFTFAPRPGTQYELEATVAGTDVEGDYDVTLTLEDLAGNVAPGLAGEGFHLDLGLPALSGLVTDRGTYSARPGFNLVTVSFDATDEAAGSSLDVELGGVPLPCARPIPAVPHWECTYLVTGGENEGSQRISVIAEDAAGNRASASTSAVFDFTPPGVLQGSEALELRPVAGGPLANITSAGAGSTAVVSFAVSETLAAVPEVASVAPAALPFGLASQVGAVYRFEHTFGAAPVQGSYRIEVTLEDQVGNLGVGELLVPAPGLTVDGAPPPPPDVLAAGKIVFTRQPWGSDASAGIPDFSLRGAAGSVEAFATVVAYDGPDLLTAGELGRGPALADGSFASFDLLRADRPALHVAAVDGAGNRSALVEVKEVEWVATLGGKVAGSIAQNPHVYAHSLVTQDAREQPDAAEPTADVGSLGLTDNFQAQSVSARTFAERRRFNPASGRAFGAMTYDAARARVVLFGGGNAALTARYQDTWEWNGDRWEERNLLGRKPAARSEAALVWDGARGRAVLFGGEAAAGLLQDTWEWDGKSWVELRPAGALPSARKRHAMAYDAARGRVVLFGGESPGLLQDLWEWDGSTWSQVLPAGLIPDARGGHAMAWDPIRGEVLIHGGSGAVGKLDELWGYSGTFRAYAPASRPAARDRATLTFDLARNRAVLLGGEGSGGPLAESFEWDGAAWTQVGLTGDRPGALHGHAAAYDVARRTTLTSGGIGTELEMWEWDGSAWDRVDAAAWPTARQGVAIAWDGNLGRPLMFGGGINLGGGSYTIGQELWSWNGRSWRPVTQPAFKPDSRLFGTMVWDSARQRVVLFGGLGGAGLLDDTWEWDGATWTRHAQAATRPPGRYWHNLAYDSARSRVVVFGGWSGVGYSNDTWEWDGNAWSQRIPVGAAPPARYSAALAFDPGLGETVLFAGRVAAGEVNDTWSWNGTRWLQRGGAGAPDAREDHALLFHPGRGRLLLFGGFAATRGVLNDVWEYDGSTWVQAGLGGALPTGRYQHAMVHDPSRSSALLFGGYGSSAESDDAWELDRGIPGKPGALVRLVVRDIPAAWISSLGVRVVGGGTGTLVDLDPADDGDRLGAPVDGIDLFGWDATGAELVPLASAPAGPGAPTALTYASPDAATARRFLSQRDSEVALLLVPAEGAGNGNDATNVAVDHVELTVRYRRP